MKQLKRLVSATLVGLALLWSRSATEADPLDSWYLRDSGATNALTAVAYGNGICVAVGNEGTILTSSDGMAWTRRDSGTAVMLNSMVFAQNLFVAVGEAGTILTSTNGTNWIARSSGTTNFLNDVNYGNGQFLAMSDTGTVVTSSNGVTWSIRLASTRGAYGVAYGNGKFVAVGGFTDCSFFFCSDHSVAYASVDAVTWTPSSPGPNVYLSDLAFGNGIFVAVGGGGTILTSADGVNWAQRNSEAGEFLLNVAFGNGAFVVEGAQLGGIYTSTNGVSWTRRNSGTTNGLFNATYANGAFFVVGNLGTILQAGFLGGPIAIPIADFAINVNAADTVIDLRAVFEDDLTPDADLVYSLAANSNPTLVSGTVDNLTDALTLDYQTNQIGAAMITVRAIDADGKYAEDTFIVTVNGIPPIVASPIADFAVNENAADTVIDLRLVFEDDLTPDADLVYSLAANSNPTLVSGTVDNLTDALTLDYQTNQIGTAMITVRATDTAGLYVEDTFMVAVNAEHDGGPGDRDPGFDPNANNTVNCPVLQPDGKILIGGAFTTIGGTTRNRSARLNADGSLDASFDPNVSGTVQSTTVQADGMIVIAGSFTSVGGTARNRLARLNADGTLDDGYNPNVDNTVFAAAVQADGKIVIGGSFTSVAGMTRNRVARLYADGTLDTGFNPNANNVVQSLALQPDGKLILVGAFSNVGGTTRNRVARLNADGTLDSSFNPNANNTVTSLALQPDGKIILGGFFQTVGGTARNRIARLNADGTLDTGFNPNLNGGDYSLALQADGRLIIAGGFTTVGGLPRNRIARLNADGTLDANFNPNANADVYGVAIQANGKVVTGGNFTTMGGTVRNRLARLENDPATQSLTVSGASRVEWLRGGTAPEAQQVVFDLSTDLGTNWTALGAGTRIPGGWELTGQSLPGSGLLRARARVTSGIYNGSSGLIEAVAAFPSVVVPAPLLTGLSRLMNGSFQLEFTNLSGAAFTALATTNLDLPLSNWTVLGPATEISSGQYQFTDQDATNWPWRFYSIRSP